MYKIILASTSPRRREMLEKLGVPFEVMPSGAREYIELEQSPYECVTILSRRKAKNVAEKVSGPAIIIGADTVVTYLGKILNKPKNRDEAAQMLKGLSGKLHTVYTGITLIFIDENGNRQTESYVDATEVVFKEMSDKEINRYLYTKEYADKAGSYSIQGRASIFIDHIKGSFNTVVGLPVSVLYDALTEHGVDITDFWE